MHRFRLLGLLAIPFLVFFLAVEGCSKKDKDKKTPTGTKPADGDGDGDGSGDSADVGDPLPAKGFAILEGVAYFKGKTPKRKVIVYEDFDPKQKVICMANKDQAKDMTWLVHDEDGKKVVENVVVYLVPPKGKYFKINPKQKSWKSKVDIDQPHCAFIPHVAVTFPKYYDDDKKLVSSGQKLVIHNSAPLAHNTKWSSPNNRERSETLAARKGDKKATPISVELNPDKEPITIQCDIHKWMKGKVWAFPHPYAAKTGKDGKFKMQVPAGVEFTIVAWHEGPGNFKKMENVKLKKGQTKKVTFTVPQAAGE
jgi:hypothetical protein